MRMILRSLQLLMRLRESGQRGGLEGRRRERKGEGPGGKVSSETTRFLNLIHGKAYYLKAYIISVCIIVAL